MSQHVEIQEMQDAAQLRSVWPLMWQLRPHLGPDGAVENAEQFVAAVQVQQKEGYRLAAAYVGGVPRALAGFRVQHMLYRGRSLYVDDLVTDSELRGTGIGKELFAWLVAEAKRLNCACLHLDSGVQRHAAHAFYFARGMKIPGFHFDLGL